MFMWGTDVAVGCLPQTQFGSPRIHFRAVEGAPCSDGLPVTLNVPHATVLHRHKLHQFAVVGYHVVGDVVAVLLGERRKELPSTLDLGILDALEL